MIMIISIDDYTKSQFTTIIGGASPRNAPMGTESHTDALDPLRAQRASPIRRTGFLFVDPQPTNPFGW